MRAYLNSKPLVKPDVYVVASDAIEEHQNNANYLCDGSGDDSTINEAVELLSETGGIIQLSEGNFSLSDEVLGDAGITIRGSGVGATVVTQTTLSKAAFNFGQNSFLGLSDMEIVMPTSSSAGDFVSVGETSAIRNINIHDLYLKGGGVNSWGGNLLNPFKFSIRNITEYNSGFRGNGILLENQDNVYYYGNGEVHNIQLGLGEADTKGIYVKGYDGAEINKTVNLTNFSGINIGTGSANGREGIVIDNGNDCTFTMCDLELLYNAIHLTNAHYNTFIGCYYYSPTNKVLMEETNTNNVWVGGRDPGITVSNGNRWI
jgi:hypothetical protein